MIQQMLFCCLIFEQLMNSDNNNQIAGVVQILWEWHFDLAELVRHSQNHF